LLAAWLPLGCLQAGFYLTANSSALTYQQVGSAVIWINPGGVVRLTVMMTCPWMIWSAPADNDGNDPNNAVSTSQPNPFARTASLLLSG
jgi:hypothetical protein